MALVLNPELEARIQANARAEGLTVEDYLTQVVQEDEDWGELSLDSDMEDTPEEAAEIRAALAESFEQVERGETRPAAEVFAELRARYDIPR